MRVVRVREKSPAPDGLRRVCYAYGCVDLTGAGLEPYLMIEGFLLNSVPDAFPPNGTWRQDLPFSSSGLQSGKTGLVSHGVLEEFNCQS